MTRIVIFLAWPMAVLLAVLTFTLLTGWQQGTGVCGTWLISVLPQGFCMR